MQKFVQNTVIYAAISLLPASSELVTGCKLNETESAFRETTYMNILKEAAKSENIEFCVAKAIYDIEYVGPFYVSSTGAVGIMELMPRGGSWTTTNYDNYQTARKQKGRIYQEKSAEEWALLYQSDLAKMAKSFIDSKDYDGLYAKDSRFNPAWNIPEGVRELAIAVHHFEAKGHREEGVIQFAFASYNAGIPAVEKGEDHVPQNGATEHYVPAAMEYLEKCRKE